MNVRRPSPLPTAPAQPPASEPQSPALVPSAEPKTPTPTAAGRLDEHDTDHHDTDHHDTDDHDTDVIVPLRSGSRDERAEPDGIDEPDTERGIGVADVWRAARNRRRALRREVRRFTARSRRRRRIWMVTAAALVALVAASVGIAYSPLFALEEITVVGTEALPAESVEAALAGQLGTPLPLIDESAVKQALVGFPLVESYTLEARPPHDLVVRIVERTPIGVIETPGGWSIVDAAGVVLSTTEDAPEGVPFIEAEGGVDSVAFESIALVMRALPDGIRTQVTSVAASTRDDVTLTLGGTDTEVVWGSVEETPKKVDILEKAMIARPPADVAVYDVSSTSAVVFR